MEDPASAIRSHVVMPAPSPNPYRQILRRRFPEPFIALLAFLLGVWLWDHYFGKKQGYEPGTDQQTMIKLDRDYRLAEVMASDPAWLRWLVGVKTPQEVKREGLKSLLILDRENSLSVSGGQTLLVMLAEEAGQPVLERLRLSGVNAVSDDFPETYDVLISRLMSGNGTWFDRSMALAYAKEQKPGDELPLALKTYESGTVLLRERAIVSRCAVWILVAIGTFFIPVTVSRLAALRGWKDEGYGKGWSASLGLVVFLSATLAWIGFGLAMRSGFVAVKHIPFWMGLALDGAMRFLPALIAVGLLFRRPSHAIRVMGLNRAPSWPLILGIFALLAWFDQLAMPLLKDWSAPDPSGGLSGGEEGIKGLTYALVSACLLAPFAEEVVYRGVLFRSLANRLGVLGGALLSSGAFALVHFYNLSGLVSVAVFGFTCALAYASSRALSTVVILHLLYNAAVKLPEWFVYHAPLY